MKGAKRAKLVITAERFRLFKQIAKKVIALAMKKPNCSPVISWFKVYLNEMKASSITYESLETFFRSFPDIQHVNELSKDENSLVRIHNKLDRIFTEWIDDHPQISESREAFLRAPPPEILRIDYNYNEAKNDAATALNDYIKTGDLIRSPDAGYDDSILYELEYFIEKRRKEIEKYLEPNTLPKGKDILKHTFIALVAPSLEGKTQSAFVFKRLRPLYFLMPEANRDADTLQPIYQNFTGLSRILQDFADMDVKDIVKSIKKSSKPIDFMQSISAGELSSTYKTAKFRVLGFLMALIEDSEAKYNVSKSWMKFHATQTRNLTFEPKSLADFKKLKCKQKYFLYLDEFEASYSNVFVRNITRAASMTVLVANTNTNLANLVGKKQASNSRNGPERVWSLVVTHLNPLNEKILDKMFPKLEEAMTKLKAKVVPRDLQVLDAFFDDFKKDQIPQMRPGFVRVIVDIIQSFLGRNKNLTFSFDEFLNDIVNSLATFLSARKPNVQKEIEGKLGSKALFLRNAYGSTQKEPLPEIYHRKNYLNYHFYYLTNPVGDNNWFFCTFSPAPTGGKDAKGDVKNYIRYKDDNSDMVDWIVERTFFKSEEVIPLLSFMGIWHEDSIAQVFDEGRKLFVDSSPGGTGDVPNTEETYQSSGNELEVLSTVCLLDASHRNVDEKKLTFTGQGGRSFLTNLIKNLIVAPSSRCRKDIEVAFSSRFGGFLDNMHVPFLYPANLTLPKFFRTNFTDRQGFNSRPVHFGPFRRMPNNDMIDCKFSFFLKSDDPSPSIPSSAVAAVECKCWEKALALSDLVKIFKKARGNGAKLCLVICKSASGSSPEYRDQCTAKGWIVLKVQKTGIRLADGTTRIIFSIKNFDSLIKIPAETRMMCLVLELDEINREITEYTIVKLKR